MLRTLFKPWRAHPELDGLSDTECREMIERRWRREVPPLRAITTVALAAALLWTPALMFALVEFTPLTRDPTLDKETVYAALAAVSLITGIAVGVGLRWFLIDAVTRRTLRRIIAGAVCPKCKHSLRGLPIVDDATRPEDRSRMRVRCPECGKPVRLLKYGYSPADLAPWEDRVLPKGFEVKMKKER
ncbi:MAG: hypothetical protein Q9O74_02205 [Planctomycetota bacterium]|nr:hypothetical protein [Planctomycetota bacterium]